MRWAKVPLDVIVALSPGELKVYAALATFANQHGEAWPSVGCVADILGVKHKASVRRRLERIIEKGFLERGGMRGNLRVYIFPRQSRGAYEATDQTPDRHVALEATSASEATPQEPERLPPSSLRGYRSDASEALQNRRERTEKKQRGFREKESAARAGLKSPPTAPRIKASGWSPPDPNTRHAHPEEETEITPGTLWGMIEAGKPEARAQAEPEPEPPPPLAETDPEAAAAFRLARAKVDTAAAVARQRDGPPPGEFVADIEF